MDQRFEKRIRRYLQKYEQQAMMNLDQLALDGWFDFWHQHLDWKGKANRAPDLVAQALLRLHRHLDTRFSHRRQQIQIFTLICPNTADSAVYLHSENSNQNNFPYIFPEIDWNCELPAALQGLELQGYEIGYYAQTDQPRYFLRRCDSY